VKVSEGTANADTTWTCTNNAPITVGTTALVWVAATGYTDEQVRDVIGTALVAGSNVTITPDDGADTITIAASGGSGGIPQLIQTLSPSAAASIDAEAFAGGGWTLLTCVLDLTVSSDNAGFTAQFKLNGSYKSDANYRRRVSATSDSGTATDGNSSAGGTAMLLSVTAAGTAVGNDTLESFNAVIWIVNPDNASKPKRLRVQSTYQNPSGAVMHCEGSGVYVGTDAASALQGIRFAVTAGTMTGTIKVFGQK
jgi:hypothetical protein